MTYIPPRPTDEDRELWLRYWQALGQAWRTEPEISLERQIYLASLRDTQFDARYGFHAFKGVELTRGDVEWLLMRRKERPSVGIPSFIVDEDPFLPDLGEGVGLSDPSPMMQNIVEDGDQYEYTRLEILGANLHRASLEGAVFCFEDWEAQAWEGSSANLEGSDLSGSHLEGADLRLAHLENANLTETHLEGADLRETDLSATDLRSANLSTADLMGTNLWFARLEDANLSEARLEGANLNEAHLKRTSFHKSNLARASLIYSDLEEADLREAILEESDLRKAQLQGADLSGLKLEGANLSEANLKGACLRRSNLTKACLSDTDLEETDLNEANLEGANFGASRLLKTNLRKANLKEAVFRIRDVWSAGWLCASMTEVNLQEANLEGADLREVRLCGLDFSATNLNKAHLENADLSGALLRGANLAETHLERAYLDETDLEGVDLGTAYLTKLEDGDLAPVYQEEDSAWPTFEPVGCTLRIALRNCKLFRRGKSGKAWSTEFRDGHTYSRTVIENEDGKITLDRIFTEPHPYELGELVYRCTNETFPSLDDFITHIRANETRYQDVRLENKEWSY